MKELGKFSQDIKIPSPQIMSSAEQSLIQKTINASRENEQSPGAKMILELNHLFESGIPLQRMLKEMQIIETEYRAWRTRWKIRSHIQTHWPYLIAITFLLGAITFIAVLYRKRATFRKWLEFHRKKSDTCPAEGQSIPLLPTLPPTFGQPSAPKSLTPAAPLLTLCRRRHASNLPLLLFAHCKLPSPFVTSFLSQYISPL